MLPAPFQPPCCHAESFLTLCVLCSMHRWPPGFSKLDTVLMVQASSPPQACDYHQVSRSGVYADAFRWQLACKCCCIFALLSFTPGSLAQSLQFFGTADAIRESARAPGTCFYRSRSALLLRDDPTGASENIHLHPNMQLFAAVLCCSDGKC